MAERVYPTELTYRDFLGTFTVEDGYTFVQGPLTRLHFEHVEEFNPVRGRTDSHLLAYIRIGEYEFTFRPNESKVLYRGRVEQ